MKMKNRIFSLGISLFMVAGLAQNAIVPTFAEDNDEVVDETAEVIDAQGEMAEEVIETVEEPVEIIEIVSEPIVEETTEAVVEQEVVELVVEEVDETMELEEMATLDVNTFSTTESSDFYTFDVSELNLFGFDTVESADVMLETMLAGSLPSRETQKLTGVISSVKILDVKGNVQQPNEHGTVTLVLNSSNNGYRYQVDFDLTKYDNNLVNGDYFTFTIPSPFYIDENKPQTLTLTDPTTKVEIATVNVVSKGKAGDGTPLGGVATVTLQNLEKYLEATKGETIKDVKGTFFVSIQTLVKSELRTVTFETAETINEISHQFVIQESTSEDPNIRIGVTNFEKRLDSVNITPFYSAALDKTVNYRANWYVRLNVRQASYDKIVLNDTIDTSTYAPMQFIPESIKVHTGYFNESYSFTYDNFDAPLVNGTDYIITYNDNYTSFELTILNPSSRIAKNEKTAAYWVSYETSILNDGALVRNLVSMKGNDTVVTTRTDKTTTESVQVVSPRHTMGGTISIKTSYSIVLYKVDSKSLNPLKDAVFTVTTTWNETITLTTDAEGRAQTRQFTSAEAAQGNFTIVETTAPNGYVIDKTPITVSIGKEGVTRTIENDPIAIGIKKVDENGEALKGVGFTLWKADTTSTNTIPTTTDVKGLQVKEEQFSDADGMLSFEAIPYGEYYIVESTTPKGYIKASAIKVKISENGLVILGEDTSNMVANKSYVINGRSNTNTDLGDGTTTWSFCINGLRNDPKGESFVLRKDVQYEDFNKYIDTKDNYTNLPKTTNKPNRASDMTREEYQQVRRLMYWFINNMSAKGSFENTQRAIRLIIDQVGSKDNFVYSEDEGVKKTQQDIIAAIDSAALDAEINNSGLQLHVFEFTDTSDPKYGNKKTQNMLTATLGTTESKQVNEVEITNYLEGTKLPEYFPVYISKTEIAGSDELPGAKLQILNGLGNEVTSWTSGTDKHEVQLEAGEYTLVETTAPNGYEVAESITFKVENTEDSYKVSVKVGENEYEEVDEYTVHMEDAATERDVYISKTEVAGSEELPGAKLEILDVTGKTVKSWTSSNEKETVKLVAGEYTLVETTAPNGYEVAESITFKVETTKDGYKVSVKQTDETYKEVENNTVHMEDAATERDVYISKTEVAGSDELSGAKLEVKDAEGNVVDSWTSTDEKHTVKLVAGEYTLVETTAPNGYEVAESITFKVETTEDGYTVSIKQEDGSYVVNTENTVHMEDAYTETEVSVTKVWDDVNNKDNLRPEKITVQLYADGELVEEVEVSEDSQWTYTFINLRQYKDGEEIEYTVKEVEVEGYTTTITGNQAEGYTITNKHTPEKPSVPDTSDEEPEKPSKPNKPKTPDTSDSTNIGAWVGLFGSVIVLTGAVWILFIDKKRRNS